MTLGMAMSICCSVGPPLDWNISTTTLRIFMKMCTDICGSQMMNPHGSGMNRSDMNLMVYIWTAIERIAMRFCTDIYIPFRINYNNVDNPLVFLRWIVHFKCSGSMIKITHFPFIHEMLSYILKRPVFHHCMSRSKLGDSLDSVLFMSVSLGSCTKYHCWLPWHVSIF